LTDFPFAISHLAFAIEKATGFLLEMRNGKWEMENLQTLATNVGSFNAVD